MQSVSQHGASISSKIIRYVLRAVFIVFAGLLLLSYGYGGFISLTTDRLLPIQMIIQFFVILIPFILGWLIDKKHPRHMIALLFLVMAYSSAAGLIAGAIGQINEVNSGHYTSLINAITLTIGHIMWLPGIYFPLYLMPLYFPTGKLLSPLWRVQVILILSHLIWWAIATILRPWPWSFYGISDTRIPNGIPGSEQFFDAISNALSIPAVLMFLLVPIAMFLRYRRAEDVERQQMKYPISSIIILLFAILTLWTFPNLSELEAEYSYPFTWSMAMLFPISIGVAILRHKLFDIDLIINRALVYGILSALIIGLYIMIVSVLGILVQAQTSVLSGLVATGIVAVIFQPLRERLQQIVNRVLYGERDDPAGVLSRLAHHLEKADTATAILPNLVQTIANTLKIPYVAIWLPTLNDKMEVVTEWGKAPEHREMISLVYQNKTIGNLVVAPRGINERFTQSERTLLTTIAALTATTVRAVQLSDELQQSRQRIVTAREEERRRIRRDLHDGLGPQLASQTLSLEAISQLMKTNPDKAQSLIKTLQTQADEAIQDVRRLVYALRPPALDDLGLVGALKQTISRYENSHLQIDLALLDIPEELPAAIETAIFRIAQEALTNVVRHSQATRCIIRLYATTCDIQIEIEDNGHGIADDYQSGVGLQAMRERASELKGETTVDALPTSGTIVKTKIPLEVYDD